MVRTLTPRQDLMLRMRAEGKGNKEIAHELGLSEQTVKNHIGEAFTRLNVDNVTRAMRAMGWVNIPPRDE